MSSDSDNEYIPGSSSESEGSWSSAVSGLTGSDVSDQEIDVASTSSTKSWCPIDMNNLPSAPPRFPFVGNPGMTVNVGNTFDPLEYFQLFFDINMINNIVDETNRFHSQRPQTSRSNWTPLTGEEFFVFISICILQGIIKKPEERMYWTKDAKLHTPFFGRVISRNRFRNIKKNLHFISNDSYNPDTHPNPKLHKIWPIIVDLNSKFSRFYIPERDISIDESLLLYKGRLSWKQFIPQKRSRFGVKFYNLCESSSGYLYKFLIYTGKSTTLDDKYKNMPVSSLIVLTLIDSLLDKGYCLTTDRFYSSPQLADYLVTCKTDFYGTVRTIRREIPPVIHRQKLKKGETIAFQRGKLMVMKWQDKRSVALLSTVHNPAMVTTRTHAGKSVVKPQVIVDYNDTMGGVDLLDQHLHDYAVARKGGKNYYRKIFFHLVDFCIYDSFVMYKKNGGQKTNLQFRLTLIDRLIETYHTETRVTHQSRLRTPRPTLGNTGLWLV
ncbi:piggyBac transposable element-derived protein 4-like [Centruroides sculpturatus]|uniref:piggyBac transposable element-derived protein 4-like n=1 Tax=Centruroides sculpturatus TaxID=218467 RepID=UPI000C6CE7CA|nr:piggyBac transposable element-derived protein 4-like [Centruroides sculpturatus]